MAKILILVFWQRLKTHTCMLFHAKVNKFCRRQPTNFSSSYVANNKTQTFILQKCRKEISPSSFLNEVRWPFLNSWVRSLSVTAFYACIFMWQSAIIACINLSLEHGEVLGTFATIFAEFAWFIYLFFSRIFVMGP